VIPTSDRRPTAFPTSGVGRTRRLLRLRSPLWQPRAIQARRASPGYPIPAQALDAIQFHRGGVPGGGAAGDRHLIASIAAVASLRDLATRWNSTAARWEAGSGATFDLAGNARRPDGWNLGGRRGSRDLPGLVRHDEVAAPGPITHAFRVTTRATNGYVWPASHQAGGTAGAPPMGTRLRLKAPSTSAVTLPTCGRYPGHEDLSA